jgi:hypothetical protein
LTEIVAAEEDHSEAAAETEAADLEGTLVLEKCTKLFVLTVAKNVKFLSSQQKENQFIVKTVIKIIKSFN